MKSFFMMFFPLCFIGAAVVGANTPLKPGARSVLSAATSEEVSDLKAQVKLLDCHARNYRAKANHAHGELECKGLDEKVMGRDRDEIPFPENCTSNTKKLSAELRARCGRCDTIAIPLSEKIAP